MKHLEELEKLIKDAKSEGEKFYTKGNASAGTRLRKLMQSIRKSAQAVRTDVQNIKKTQPENKGK